MKKLFVVGIIFISGLLLSGCSIMDNYPVKMYLCGSGYKDCHVVAKFKDMNYCQRANKKLGWYCDETNKSNIVCEEKDSQVSISYCSE